MSSFSVALSGLTAASGDLDVTDNNVANADTVGFKSSRAEFADVFAWLCTLANINDIDLAAVIRQKYLADAPPAGHK